MHWACYTANDIAIYYLNSWSCNVNLQDKNGYTPLHMVVFASESFDEDHADKAIRYRAVRELLIKGAERDIRDNLGKRAYDYACEMQDEDRRTKHQ